MEKLKIEELKRNLKKYDDTTCGVDCLCYYSPTTYLYDILWNISDANVDIYNYNLLEWLKDNYTDFEETIDEYGVSSDRFDLIRYIQMAQCRAYERELTENLQDTMLYYIYDMIEGYFEEITEKEIEQIEELANNFIDKEILPDYNEIIEAWEELKESEGE